ncbi:MAG: hypothetical protein HC923_01140 [Myxococcales bacterium]|nr:hypothetical protein [Myxococcales bacterium]
MSEEILLKLLTNAVCDLAHLAGEPFPTAPLRMGWELEQLRKTFAAKAREQRTKLYTDHCAALKVIIDEANLEEPGLMGADEMMAKLDLAKARFRKRRDAMHDADAVLRKLDDDAWLAINATAGDPPDHNRLARARSAALRRVEPATAKVRETLDAILFGMEDEEEEKA